jgi:hypothetical protein
MQCLGPRSNPSQKRQGTQFKKRTNQSVPLEWRRKLFSSTNLIGWIVVDDSGFLSESWIGPLQPTSLFHAVTMVKSQLLSFCSREVAVKMQESR